MNKISLAREINELKNQLAYSKNIGFFFGAGTSCALNIPNVEQLTQAVQESLVTANKANYNLIKADLTSDPASPASAISQKCVNIEDILNHIRRIRELTCDGLKQYQGVSGEAAKILDEAICAAIYKIITEKERSANIENTRKFFAWLSLLNNDFSKEIYTTNYDLIIEKSLEASHIPYFDGFVGSYEPFFWQESIDKLVAKDDLTQNWIRLWKIHGSLSWFWKVDPQSKSQRIVRLGKIDSIDDEKNELVIYPSKEKYDSSRKQPFIAYFDRLKKYLLNGELLFVFTGYSFSDQHINEVIFNCLRQNNRLSVLVFFYRDDEVESLNGITSSYMNINVFGPTKAIINGTLGVWDFPELESHKNDGKKIDHYWDENKSSLKLGDFNCLSQFLITNSGKKDAIESLLK